MFARILTFLMFAGPVALSFYLPAPGMQTPGQRHILQEARIPCCLFRSFTGIPCPLCGLTRSFVSFAHGRLEDAFLFHALGPPVFLLFIFGALWQFRPRAAKRPDGPPPQPGKWGKVMTWTGGGLLLAAYVVKLTLVPRFYW